MGSKMRTYAENELGVHKVYETATKASADLTTEHSKLLEARARRRDLTEQIADREAAVLKNIRDNHTDLSVTAQDAKAKIERRTDQELRTMRTALLAAQRAEDEAEQKIKELNKTIDIATARMIQLGGYFPFLVKIMEQDAVAQQNTP